MVSDEGRHDGLYWHGAYNEFDSPINRSSRRRPQKTHKTSRRSGPLQRYFSASSLSQGPHAPGGAELRRRREDDPQDSLSLPILRSTNPLV